MNNHQQHLRYLERITYLAQRKAAGRAQHLSSRLNIVHSSVYLHLKFLKNKGIPIRFSPADQSYVID